MILVGHTYLLLYITCLVVEKCLKISMGNFTPAVLVHILSPIKSKDVLVIVQQVEIVAVDAVGIDADKSSLFDQGAAVPCALKDAGEI